MTGLRPKASESGPVKKVPIPMPTRKEDRISCAALGASGLSLAAISGRAGSIESIEKAVIAVIIAIRATNSARPMRRSEPIVRFAFAWGLRRVLFGLLFGLFGPVGPVFLDHLAPPPQEGEMTKLLDREGEDTQAEEDEDGRADLAERGGGHEAAIAHGGERHHREEIGVEPAPAFGIFEEDRTEADDRQQKPDQGTVGQRHSASCSMISSITLSQSSGGCAPGTACCEATMK